MAEERIEPIARAPRVWVRAWIARTLVVFAIVSTLVAIGGLAESERDPVRLVIICSATCAAIVFAGLRRVVKVEPFCALCGDERKDVEQMVSGSYGAVCGRCIAESTKVMVGDVNE